MIPIFLSFYYAWSVVQKIGEEDTRQETKRGGGGKGGYSLFQAPRWGGKVAQFEKTSEKNNTCEGWEETAPFPADPAHLIFLFPFLMEGMGH